MINKVAILLVLMVASAAAFIHSNSVRKQHSNNLEQYATSTDEDRSGKINNNTKDNVLLQFFQGWFNIFTPIEKRETLTSNLSGYKTSYKSQLKNKKVPSFWKKQDIVNDFAATYLGNNVKDRSNTKKLLGKLSQLQDEEELLDSLDEYLVILQKSRDDPFTASERFIADTIMEMAKPMTNQMDKTKIFKPSMKFPKPMKLKNLVKTLKSNPNYFK